VINTANFSAAKTAEKTQIARNKSVFFKTTNS